MVALVGEQPIPNLMSIRYYRPARVTWVFTSHTEPVVDRLQPLVHAQQFRCRTDAFDITRIEQDLKANLPDVPSEAPWFNLTGGTKPMGYAAYNVARQMQAPIVYLQGGPAPVHYEYVFQPDGNVAMTCRELRESVLDIDTYLRAHVGRYTRGPVRRQREAFVDAVARALEGAVDEVFPYVVLTPVLELDLVIRLGNTVAVAELKTGKKAIRKEGIDQLATATEPTYLGSHTRRLLITDRLPNPDLAALAQARGIRVLTVPDWVDGAGNGLSPQAASDLARAVVQALA